MPCPSMTIFSVLVDKQCQFFVFNIIYKLLLTSWTGIFLFNIMLTEVDTFTSITHHYSNAITQFITQFITQIPLLKSVLIIIQMPFSLLIITPPLLKGHFADDGVPRLGVSVWRPDYQGTCNASKSLPIIWVHSDAPCCRGSLRALVSATSSFDNFTNPSHFQVCQHQQSADCVMEEAAITLPRRSDLSSE